MNSFAEAGLKYEAHLYGAGHLVFMMCDATSRKILKQCERDGKLSLKGSDDDPTSSALIESVISGFATETSAEIVRNKTEILFGNVSCNRRQNEIPNEFPTQVRGAITRNVNTSTMLSPAVSRKFVVMMLRNDNLFYRIL